MPVLSLRLSTVLEKILLDILKEFLMEFYLIETTLNSWKEPQNGSPQYKSNGIINILKLKREILRVMAHGGSVPYCLMAFLFSYESLANLTRYSLIVS